MLQCNETVTLVRLTDTEDGDEYQCAVIHGASWHAKVAVTTTATGLQTASMLKCRIPQAQMPEGMTPQKKDIFVRGEVLCIKRLEDLKAYEWFTVTAVGDNRRGNLAHWAVTGA